MFAYLASEYHESFDPQPWQIWLMYIAIISTCAAIICLLPTFIPLLEKAFFFCSLIGFVVFFITILATESPKHTSHTVFVEFNNESGWSDGLAFIISCGTAMYAFIGTDSAIHISEVILPHP